MINIKIIENMAFGLGRLFSVPFRAVAGFATPVKREIHHITGFNPALTTRIMPSSLQNSSSLQVDATSPQMTAGGVWSLIATRFFRRVHYIKEQKRLRKYSWLARMSTEKGRVIIMKRMLKGRFVYTH